jgi:hypothetical protein
MRSIREVERERKKIERSFERRFALLFAQQLGAFQRELNKDTLQAIEDMDRFFSKGVKPLYEKMMRRTANKFRGEEVVKADIWVDAVTAMIDEIGGKRITELIAYSKKYVLRRLRPILNQGIREGLSVREIGKLIVADIGEYKLGFSRYRSERIVRTEVVSTSNWASLESVKQSGVRVVKKWQTEMDGRERETHAEAQGQTVQLDERFKVRRADGGWDLLEYPGDPSGSPGNVINCRCTVIYERMEN